MIELKERSMPELVISKQILTDGQKEDESGPTSSLQADHGEITKGSALLKVKLEEDIESLVSFGARKRKRLTRSQPKGEACRNTAGQAENSSAGKKNKVPSYATRWSAERYMSAEQNMVDIMKAKGALFDKRISRQELRTAARKQIGDTGLLDHLLKHIDGKVTPSGVDRFRRCYNTDGVLEYWLESADLVDIKREAGVLDPNWVPPSWWKDDNVPHESTELKLLKEEIVKMKSEIKDLLSRLKAQDQLDATEKMYKDFVSWRTKTDGQISEISNLLTSTKEVFKELSSWKDKADQQLSEISNSLSNLQAQNNSTTLSPAPEEWEDWFHNTNLGDLIEDGFEPLFTNSDLSNALPETIIMQDPYTVQQKPHRNPFLDVVCVEEQQLINHGVQITKRNESGTSSQDNTNASPDSSITARKSDTDATSFLSQEMLKELVTWKAKVEQQITEMSKAVIGLQRRC